MDNRLTIFTPRILLAHDQDGQLRLSHEELSAYDEAKRRIGDRANEALHRKRLKTGAAAHVSQRSIARQHALQDAIAFDQPMVERARDMERDNHADHNPADQMPDENAVR